MPGKGLPIASEGDHTPRHTPAPKGKEGFASDLPNLPGGFRSMARATTPKKTATTPPDCGKVQTQAPKGHFTPFRICHDLPEFAKLEHFSPYSSTLV